MSILAELDQLRAELSAPGAPFEMVEQPVGGVSLPVYRHLPRNLSRLIVDANGFDDRTFVVSGARRLSYGETLGRAAGLAAWLRNVAGGAPIAIAMANSPEWIIAFLAIQLAGATSVLVNSRGSADEMAHALQHCALLIADRRRADAVRDAYQGTIVITGEDGQFLKDDAAIGSASAPLAPSDADPNDTAMILFTSGTTGRPKGAMLSHRGVATALFNMRHNGAAYLASAARQRRLDPAVLAQALPQPASLAIFPLFHVSGVIASLLMALQFGGKLVLMERWDPAQALALIGAERITAVQGPPMIFRDLLDCPDFPASDLGSVGNLGIGGQATPEKLLARMTRALPLAAPGGGYGMTETNGAIAAATGAEYLANPAAAGRILPGTDVRIADEAGTALPLGQVGEIQVRSALVMTGYWNDPAATEAAFSDGWFRTGDIGRLDADRFLTILDRKKDVIIRGGENIYAAELERVFQDCPGVLEVAAFGVPDERWGEQPVLAAVMQPGRADDPAALLDFARDRLAGYKLPAEIRFVDEAFPRTPVGKIDKRALRRALFG